MFRVNKHTCRDVFESVLLDVFSTSAYISTGLLVAEVLKDSNIRLFHGRSSDHHLRHVLKGFNARAHYFLRIIEYFLKTSRLGSR